MKVVVTNILQGKIAAFHDEGLQVFSLIEQSIIKDEAVEISFEGIERCATQFLNASIGKAYLLSDPAKVDKLLTYSYGTLSNLKDKIAEVRDNAIHSKAYDSLLQNATA